MIIAIIIIIIIIIGIGCQWSLFIWNIIIVIIDIWWFALLPILMVIELPSNWSRTGLEPCTSTYLLVAPICLSTTTTRMPLDQHRHHQVALHDHVDQMLAKCSGPLPFSDYLQFTFLPSKPTRRQQQVSFSSKEDQRLSSITSIFLWL